LITFSRTSTVDPKRLWFAKDERHHLSSMETSVPDKIKAMTDAIVAASSPCRVVLFGSQAANRAGADSDVDFLVVEDGPFRDEHERLKEMTRLWKVLAPFRTPTDLLVYTEEEVAHWSNTTNHIIARAMREGRVLYERPSA